MTVFQMFDLLGLNLIMRLLHLTTLLLPQSAVFRLTQPIMLVFGVHAGSRNSRYCRSSASPASCWVWVCPQAVGMCDSCMACMQLLQPRIIGLYVACTSVTVTFVSSSISLFLILFYCGNLQWHFLNIGGIKAPPPLHLIIWWGTIPLSP